MNCLPPPATIYKYKYRDPTFSLTHGICLALELVGLKMPPQILQDIPQIEHFSDGNQICCTISANVLVGLGRSLETCFDTHCGLCTNCSFCVNYKHQLLFPVQNLSKNKICMKTLIVNQRTYNVCKKWKNENNLASW